MSPESLWLPAPSQLGGENAQELLKSPSSSTRGWESSMESPGLGNGLGQAVPASLLPTTGIHIPKPCSALLLPQGPSKGLSRGQTAQLSRSHSGEVFILCSAFISLCLTSGSQSPSPFLTPLAHESSSASQLPNFCSLLLLLPRLLFSCQTNPRSQ